MLAIIGLYYKPRIFAQVVCKGEKLKIIYCFEESTALLGAYVYAGITRQVRIVLRFLIIFSLFFSPQ